MKNVWLERFFERPAPCLGRGLIRMSQMPRPVPKISLSSGQTRHGSCAKNYLHWLAMHTQMGFCAPSKKFISLYNNKHLINWQSQVKNTCNEIISRHYHFSLYLSVGECSLERDFSATTQNCINPSVETTVAFEMELFF